MYFKGWQFYSYTPHAHKAVRIILPLHFLRIVPLHVLRSRRAYNGSTTTYRYSTLRSCDDYRYCTRYVDLHLQVYVKDFKLHHAYCSEYILFSIHTSSCKQNKTLTSSQLLKSKSREVFYVKTIL